MYELTQEKRDGLIEKLSVVSARLSVTADGPERNLLKADVRELARLIWLDGRPSG